MSQLQLDEIRYRQKALKYHQQRLASIKPSPFFQLDSISVDRQRSMSYSRQRDEQMKKINYENQQLQQKLESIYRMKKENPNIHRLCKAKQQQMMEEIKFQQLNENLILSKRIQNAQPSINLKDYKKSFQLHQSKLDQSRRVTLMKSKLLMKCSPLIPKANISHDSSQCSVIDKLKIFTNGQLM